MRVEDTGAGFGSATADSTRGSGVGLSNVRRRLELCYGPTAQLEIHSSPSGSTVGFRIPLAANQPQAGAA